MAPIDPKALPLSSSNRLTAVPVSGVAVSMVWFRLNHRIIGWVLALVVFALSIAHFGLGYRGGAFSILNLGSEASFGTALSSLAGFVGGAFAWVAYTSARRRGMAHLVWLALSIGLLLYAMDEVAMMHERLARIVSGPIRDVPGDGKVGTVTIGLFLIPVFIVVIWATIRSAARPAASFVGSGLGLFWLSAFGVEELEYVNAVGALPFLRWMSIEQGSYFLIGVQETGEMAGVALVVFGLLAHLAMQARALGFEVVSGYSPR